jgi:RND family efflux transporter MFP subunit
MKVIGTMSVLMLLALAGEQDGKSFKEDGGFEGIIEPFRIVFLSGGVDGLLDSVTVDRGDMVREGQVLATIESSVEKATLDLASARAVLQAGLKAGQARTQFMVRKFAKEEDLFTKGFVSTQEVDDVLTDKVLADMNLLQAQENLEVARLEKEQANASYMLKTIRSPISGVVVERYLSPGELLSRMSQLKIMKLAQLDPLRVEVILPIGRMGQVTTGMKAEVTPEGPLGSVQTAEVKVVDQVADAASGTFGVRLEMPNPGNRLPAGLKCKVRFLR